MIIATTPFSSPLSLFCFVRNGVTVTSSNLLRKQRGGVVTQKLDTGVSENVQGEKQFGTKAKAILAGGMVLGVGAAITLAAWTDTEWATGLFGSGSFGIEGSTNGTAWSDNPVTGAPASLSFAVGADNLTPGSAVYALYAVQLKDGSTNEAEVAVSQNEASKIAGTTASYKYVTGATCDATAYGTGTNENGTSFDLTATEAPTYLCFQVTADNTMPQGADGSITWTFTATSGDAL